MGTEKGVRGGWKSAVRKGGREGWKSKVRKGAKEVGPERLV